MAAQVDAGGQSGNVNINNLLVRESGRISGEIYRRTIDTSPWLKLIKQDKWPNQMGDNLSVMTYERTMTGSEVAWTDINSTSAKFCIPDAEVVPVAQTTQTYNLQHKAVESDPICVHDVRFGYRFREQLASVYDNLVENVAWVWKNRYRDQYADWAHHNIVATRNDHSGGAGATTGPLAEAKGLLMNTGGTAGLIGGKGMPDQDQAGSDIDFVETDISKLTQGILNRVYMQLIRDGGGTNPMGRADGRPVFTLITSAETSDNIIRSNFNGTRTDYRESAKVNELLKPLGVERSHRGFFHIIDPFPKRWNYDPDGTTGVDKWVEVPAYIAETAAYQGQEGDEDRWIVNPDYETANYEDSYVFHQDVIKSLIPAPLGAAGSGVNFNPLTYRGSFDFKNIPDRFDNPDGSWGYFRGVLANGAKPCKPQYGFVIRHKRCDELGEFLDCSDASYDA